MISLPWTIYQSLAVCDELRLRISKDHSCRRKFCSCDAHAAGQHCNMGAPAVVHDHASSFSSIRHNCPPIGYRQIVNVRVDGRAVYRHICDCRIHHVTACYGIEPCVWQTQIAITSRGNSVSFRNANRIPLYHNPPIRI